ncbi:MAG: Holliday junction resolvase RecU [Bacillota bacterium]
MIRYPNGKKAQPQPKTKTSVKNRGMPLETMINESNRYYLEQDLAVIHKKPTPVQVANVHYPQRSKAKITEAYYKSPSTTDYNGVYKGYYVDFDVKESQNKTSFPLKNIHPHQINHLKQVASHGGIAFLIIRLVSEDTYWLIGFERIQPYLKRAKTGRKSMTIDEIKAESHPIPEGFRPRLDYLKALDKLIAIKKA